MSVPALLTLFLSLAFLDGCADVEVVVRRHEPGTSPATPGAGSWRFLLFKGSFLPGGLVPGRSPEPGRYFREGGAWSRVATGNVGLCSPQRSVDGPPPPCEPPEE